MPKLVALLFLPLAGPKAQIHPLQQLIDAARANSPGVKDLLGQALPLRAIDEATTAQAPNVITFSGNRRSMDDQGVRATGRISQQY
jgi:hypothetical protein